MERHHLCEADLQTEPEDIMQKAREARQVVTVAWVGPKVATWERIVSGTVVEIVGGIGSFSSKAQRILTPSGLPVRDDEGNPKVGTPISYYGAVEDCCLAVRLFDEIRAAVIALARLRYGNVYRGDGAAYAEGFAIGLYAANTERVNAARAKAIAEVASDNRGLILIERREELIVFKKDLADKWLASPAGGSIRLGKIGRRQGSNGSESARDRGERDGGQYSVDAARSKKIGG